MVNEFLEDRLVFIFLSNEVKLGPNMALRYINLTSNATFIKLFPFELSLTQSFIRTAASSNETEIFRSKYKIHSADDTNIE